MDWDRIEGNWKQIKGKVKEQWGKLTDDDLDEDSGAPRTAGGQRSKHGMAWRRIRFGATSMIGTADRAGEPVLGLREARAFWFEF